jgi:hypothetical protein
LGYLLLRVYIRRIGAFGCFDDCFNYGAGYFLLSGKRLYTDIFFNHQPLGAYLSALVQYVSKPKTLYELVLSHRIAVSVLSICGGIAITLRFGFRGFLSFVVFESTKFYVFGDRFLAEALATYPLMWVFFLWLEIAMKRAVHTFDAIIGGTFLWFVFFLREPLAMVVIGLLASISFLQWKRARRWVLLFAGTFLLCAIVLFTQFNFVDYLFNVLTVNSITQIRPDTVSWQLLVKAFVYPILLISQLPHHIFGWILFVLSLVFLLSFIFLVQRRQYRMACIGIFVLLGLANIRVVDIGCLFGNAFHMICWYGVYAAATIALVFLVFKEVKRKGRMVFYALPMLGVFVLTVYGIRSNFFSGISAQDEFTYGYATIYAHGEVIRRLSDPGDSLFVEMWEDLVYWYTKLPSSYRYSWYTSVMPFFEVYTKERMRMWENNPPDFYVGSCRPNEPYSYLLPSALTNFYIQLHWDGKPSCLYVLRSKAKTIPQTKYDSIRDLGYYVPYGDL